MLIHVSKLQLMLSTKYTWRRGQMDNHEKNMNMHVHTIEVISYEIRL